MKFNEMITIKGKMRLLTGTRIGASNDIIEIGGNDNPVMRDPLTKDVYIPGSSIKGKMRMMMEWLTGNIDKKGEVHSCAKKDCPICRVFGRKAEDSKEALTGPTRIIVKDAFLTEKSRELLKKLREENGTDTEWKSENTINRLTSSANPRNLERIPAGIEFNFSISYKVLDLDETTNKTDRDLYKEVVLKGLKMLSIEGIGGGISRGSGHIEFVELKEYTTLNNSEKDILNEVNNITI